MLKISFQADFLNKMFCFFLILVNFAYLPFAPDSLPYHFDLDGKASSFASSLWVLILLPCIAFSLRILAKFFIENSLPKFQMKKSTNMLDNILLGLTISIFFGDIAILSYPFFFSERLTLIFGHLAIAAFCFQAARFFPSIEQNFFIGIRTPWAILDEANWIATHRLAGLFLWISSVISFIGALFGFQSLLISLFVLIFGLIAPIPYSYWVFKRGKA